MSEEFISERVETLLLARLSTSPKNQPTPTGEELAEAMKSYALLTIEEPRWREVITEALQRLRDQQLVTAQGRLASADELKRRLGLHMAKRWQQWSERLLPALALSIQPGDARAHKRLDGRDAWCAAIAGRVLGLWTDGPPPTPAAVGAALVSRELGLASIPRSCPPWLRAHFLRKHITADTSAPEQLLRQLAVRAVGAPNAGIQAIYAGLVRMWLTGRALGISLVDAVGTAARDAREGVFGDRKVFISSVWDAVRATPAWSTISLDDFKAQLVAAHRRQELVLARADLVAAMDPALVAASETRTDGATFHFVVREPTR